jgi:hypothetical protein
MHHSKHIHIPRRPGAGLSDAAPLIAVLTGLIGLLVVAAPFV